MESKAGRVFIAPFFTRLHFPEQNHSLAWRHPDAKQCPGIRKRFRCFNVSAKAYFGSSLRGNNGAGFPMEWAGDMPPQRAKLNWSGLASKPSWL